MKRSFRPRKTTADVKYPTLKTFARGLRSTILGVAIAAGAAGCDSGDNWSTGGLPDRMPAPLDAGTDAFPDHSGGLPDMPSAPLDLSGVADAMPTHLDLGTDDDIYIRPDMTDE